MKRAVFLTIILAIVLYGVYLFSHNLQKPTIEQSPLEKAAKEIIETATNDPVIIAVGDLVCGTTHAGGSECHHARTATLVEKIRPVAILTLGDLQYQQGSYGDFMRYYEPTWGKYKKITRPVPGNHEYETTDAKGYFDYFNGKDVEKGIAGERDKGYYSFNIQNWHVLALNSNCWAVGGCTEASEQYQWARQDLLTYQTQCSIAFMHHPLFSSGKHGGHDFVEPLWELLDENGVDILLAGHDHIYERFSPQDIDANKSDTGLREFIVGTGGRNLYAFESVKANSEMRLNEYYGVLKLQLKEFSYLWEFVDTSGKVLDSGSSDCIK